MQPEENPAQPAENQNAAAPAPENRPSLRDAKLESTHADLPPMSVIGGDTSTPTAAPGQIAQPKQFGRRGAPRGGQGNAAPGALPNIGAINDPADMTE